jgi:hypothetical protein
MLGLLPSFLATFVLLMNELNQSTDCGTQKQTPTVYALSFLDELPTSIERHTKAAVNFLSGLYAPISSKPAANDTLTTFAAKHDQVFKDAPGYLFAATYAVNENVTLRNLPANQEYVCDDCPVSSVVANFKVEKNVCLADRRHYYESHSFLILDRFYTDQQLISPKARHYTVKEKMRLTIKRQYFESHSHLPIHSFYKNIEVNNFAKVPLSDLIAIYSIELTSEINPDYPSTQKSVSYRTYSDVQLE